MNQIIRNSISAAHRAAVATTVAACALFVSAASAEDYIIVPDQFVYCTTCHGVELQGNRSVDAPRLNGMEDWYLRNQLEAFRKGWRGTHPLDLTGMEMLPQATVLDPAGLTAAVEFATGVAPRTDRPTTVSGNIERGAQLYASCAACHGEKAEGNPRLNAPRLAGQSDWYLADTLEKYRLGIRGGSTGDTYGAQMRGAVSTLPDAAAVADVVAYINTLY